MSDVRTFVIEQMRAEGWRVCHLSEKADVDEPPTHFWRKGENGMELRPIHAVVADFEAFMREPFK
jgi:hypothetical protein